MRAWIAHNEAVNMRYLRRGTRVDCPLSFAVVVIALWITAAMVGALALGLTLVS